MAFQHESTSCSSHPLTGWHGFNDLGIFLTKGGAIVGTASTAGTGDKGPDRALARRPGGQIRLEARLPGSDLLIHDNISSMHARPKITGTVEHRASRELKRVTLDIIWNQYAPTGAASAASESKFDLEPAT